MYAFCFFVSILPCTLHAQTITTVAGNGTFGYSGNGGPALEAILFEPVSISFDPSGNLFFADYRNFIVRGINHNGMINTVAGNDTAGYAGDGGPAPYAEISGPTGVAVDRAGNIFIADYDNQVIRKVSAGSGIITTVAGIGVAGYDGDSLAATQAELNNPAGVAVDAIGNLYIADNGNNVIRRVDTLA